MCIIAAKKRGIPLPDNWDDILTSCWSGNSHGAGIALKRDGTKRIYVSKGHMKLDDLKAELISLGPQREDELLVHFRMATHGSKGPEMTHPFVVAGKDSVGILANKCFVETAVLVHNGIFNGFPRDTQYSDTYYFTKDVLGSFNPTASNRAAKKWRKRFTSHILGQRLGFIYPNEDMELIGRFIYHKGIFYSNSSFKLYRPVHRSDRVDNAYSCEC